MRTRLPGASGTGRERLPFEFVSRIGRMDANAVRSRNAVSVSGNRRVTFRFEDGAAVDADCVDDHWGDRSWACMIRRIRAAS